MNPSIAASELKRVASASNYNGKTASVTPPPTTAPPSASSGGRPLLPSEPAPSSSRGGLLPIPTASLSAHTHKTERFCHAHCSWSGCWATSIITAASRTPPAATACTRKPASQAASRRRLPRGHCQEGQGLSAQCRSPSTLNSVWYLLVLLPLLLLREMGSRPIQIVGPVQLLQCLKLRS